MTRSTPTARFLYVFLDEGGNFDFSPGGTSHFTLSCVTRERPFPDYSEFVGLKYDLLEQGRDIEYFHASEDQQIVRNHVFEIIRKNLKGMRIDSVVVNKRKTHPSLRDPADFYPKMLGYLLGYVLTRVALSQYAEVLIFTDRIPVSKKRKAVEKTIKMTLADILPKTVRYRILHHDSKSNFQLQIADYCNWAIYRKWEIGDVRSYDLIKTAIKSEFDIFRTGKTLFY